MVTRRGEDMPDDVDKDARVGGAWAHMVKPTFTLVTIVPGLAWAVNLGGRRSEMGRGIAAVLWA